MPARSLGELREQTLYRLISAAGVTCRIYSSKIRNYQMYFGKLPVK